MAYCNFYLLDYNSYFDVSMFKEKLIILTELSTYFWQEGFFALYCQVAKSNIVESGVEHQKSIK
jgi:REP element-mobilizing transposase RayT